MARRKSPKPVTGPTTLRFICIAIRDAKGDAGASINKKVAEFADKMTDSVGTQLIPNQLGIFAGGQTATFDEWKPEFAGALEEHLRNPKINWVGDDDGTAGALEKCIKAWDIDTTLGEMFECLINEFDDKIEYVDPVALS